VVWERTKFSHLHGILEISAIKFSAQHFST
jgi:hypothetical protein